MTAQAFLDGRVTLHCGDCLDVLAAMPENSVDSVVCDPPYHLTSIVKRFGGDGAAEAKGGATGAYQRASAGFMGKQWDGGDIAFQPATWAAVLRVLKPGGHIIAFSGTRTYHRMAVAIEDAGFEIRDQLAWTYGSGFPKSHDVSKSIDKRKNWSALPRLQSAIGDARRQLGISQSEAARRMGLIGPSETLGGGGFMWFETGMRAPTREQWPQLKAALGIGDEFDECFEEVEREITGIAEEWQDRSNYAITSKDGYRRDKPASELAKQWHGWGTALKPAWEPICLGRKTIEGTVAATVLQHGTGAINVGGCRVGVDKFPANLLHDGSESVLEAFGGEDDGWPTRFFYTAKADAEDRIGSKHPTVKPLDLMQYLCRLVTPPGGTVLDCFAGTGSTGEAAWREGFNAILIEREPEYQADIARRMDLALKPTKRAAVAKSKNNLQGAEGTPLFGGEAA